VIAKRDAITYEARTIGAILFMRGIMAIKPRLEKPLIFRSYDTHEERASMLVSDSLGAEIAARFGPRNETPLSILAYDGDVLAGGLNASPIGDGATSVISGSRRTGGVKVSDAGCWRTPRWKPARGSASASTSIHSIRGGTLL